MKSIEAQKKKINYIIGAAAAVISLLVLTCMITLARTSTDQKLENRVFDELKSTTGMQAAALTETIESLYDPLYVIEDMLEKGVSFTGEEMSTMLDSLVDTQDLRMLGLADLEGSAVTYTGDVIGNVSDRKYFKAITDGADRGCERLETTRLANETRFIFSIPSYDEDGNFNGVLCCSKEISSLEDSLFEMKELFNSSIITFVCDEEGKVIVANDSAYYRLHDFYLKDGEKDVFDLIPDLTSIMDDDSKSVSKIDMRGTVAYASLVSLDINGWQLVCIVDEDTALKTYAGGLAIIRELVNKSIIIFMIALAFIMLMAYSAIRENYNQTRIIRGSYENYMVLLREMNCTVIEYDPKAEDIFTLKTKDNPYGLEIIKSFDDYKEFTRRHPEFDSEELGREFDLVRENNTTSSFETIFRLDSGEIRWVKLLLIPIMNEANNFKIFIAILDVSDVHSEFELTIDNIYNIPGGIYRCYLNDPAHLQYYSQRLCEMLGYTYEEVEDIITAEHNYSLLIYPDDRHIYDQFIKDIGKTGGIKTCEYRMVCSDGKLLAARETMEARKNDSGIMYGYAVVTDLEKYRQMQEELELELEDTKQQLQQARIRNSNSQMQPHFLYNALASIREIVLEDPEYASDLLYDFTTHLRACIKSMGNDNLIPFTQELENVKAYVNIEKMRFGDRIDVRYYCDETDFTIVPLSIQPLVENAIRHGIYERNLPGGIVNVRAHRSDNIIIVQVEDNGNGFDYDKVLDEVSCGERDSTGLVNLIFRFKSLQKASVNVESREGEGTRITVSIPVTGEIDESHIS